MTWKVNYFQTSRADSTVQYFIEKQDMTTQTKIVHYITLLKEYGPFLKPPYCKKLGNILYELRITGKNALRIFYTLINNE